MHIIQVPWLSDQTLELTLVANQNVFYNAEFIYLIYSEDSVLLHIKALPFYYF